MTGKVYHAAAQAGLKKTRPMFTFVPDSLIKNGKLDEKSYTAQRWASINCSANKFAIGSHLFPDLDDPATKEESDKFLKNLKKFTHKHKGKPDETKLPGLPLKQIL